mmetsp:Transcript_17122/g.19827  ORF Transcript_17122/g.19827 Transcript_17122/m.19827 type:complete len:100 (-) Transcript_17122:262-561(-)
MQPLWQRQALVHSVSCGNKGKVAHLRFILQRAAGRRPSNIRRVKEENKQSTVATDTEEAFQIERGAKQNFGIVDRACDENLQILNKNAGRPMELCLSMR